MRRSEADRNTAPAALPRKQGLGVSGVHRSPPLRAACRSRQGRDVEKASRKRAGLSKSAQAGLGRPRLPIQTFPGR